ncbi:hypothetical protein MIMGU_mgv1a020645mg [Erythranthe guttata]|uniref:Glycosyltransferase n=2 Tax=Erythranthe guttata TaxID=4155 RepID=A0A022PS29_ERYGU|nr:hypothetical protein MIMGU_mgv1a020645mg [Erythranthe guttata]
MDKEKKEHRVHILCVPYPSQGHVNPMLQFCKRLVSKGAKATFTITNFISKSINPKSDSVDIASISDGFDAGGFQQAESVSDYLNRMEVEGSRTLENLIKSYRDRNLAVDCIVYDAFLPWVLDVTMRFGIRAACFFTQACAVNYVYYYVHRGLLDIPVVTPPPVEIPGLPPLELPDLPSFMHVSGSYPAYFEMVLNQFSNVDKADFVLVNTFYKLEEKVVDSMTKVCPMLTIGPTLPSFYLDNRIENDDKYDVNLFQSDPSQTILDWLNTKPPKSVVYIAFGSMDNLPKAQMEEIAWGLNNTNFDFLWVIRVFDKEEKLPESFVRASSERALFAHWSPQLEVLSNEAIGCFFSHGGWNSTTEALSLGVPMVVMPQWTDQTTDAKLVQDVWGVGIRVRVSEENGIVRREEIESCVREVMEGEKGKEMKRNCVKWRDLAKEAVSEGGTSDLNIDAFISKLECS